MSSSSHAHAKIPHQHSSDVARAAMRKATWRLIPLICLGYGMAYMDRINISFAALEMNRDLGFSATVYGLGAGLFFVSYSLCEIPSNLMLHKMGARLWMTRIMITWGLLAATMMFVHTAWQFYLVRFLLGMAEAGYFPGVIYYLMLWFPLSMRARTISRFYIALPLSSVLMGSLAGTLLGLDGHFGLRGWQWLFLVEGLPAVLASALFWRYLPDRPEDAAWLKPDEKRWLLTQLAAEDEQIGAGRDHLVGAALKDRRVWLLGLYNMCMLGVLYAFSFSAPTILRQVTGWSDARVGYFVAAYGALGVAGMLLGAWSSDRMGERHLHVMVPSLVMATSLAICGVSVSRTTVLVLFPVLFVAYNTIQGALLSLPGTFLRGKSAAAGVAAINMVGMAGGFLGPYWMGWARDTTGNYRAGEVLLAVVMIVGAALMLMLRRDAGKVQAHVSE